VQAEHQFFFENAEQADEAFDNGSLVYNLGMGFNFGPTASASSNKFLT
jgi:hypothetical protein